MSTNQETPAKTAIMSYDEELARIAAETQAALTSPKANFISLKGRVFTLPDDTQIKEIECVVIDYIRINQKMTPYAPNQRPVTLCWAIGRNDKALAPGDEVPDPVCKTCAECPDNTFGSKGKGKACSNKMRLVVVPPDATNESELWLLHIPPTSLSDWTNYVKLIDRQLGASGTMRCITRIRMHTEFDYPRLAFQFVRPLPISADPEAKTASLETILKLRAAAQDTIYTPPLTE